MANWMKTTPYGDYRDPLQNHKFDGQLLFDKEGRFKGVYKKLKNILHEASWYYGKHIGSKKLSNIKALNRKANSTRHLVKSYVRNKKENSSEELESK